MTAATCHGCGVPLPPSKGRPRKWCGERCRRAQYAGTCVDCGAPTNGSNGRAAAPEHCGACNPRNAAFAAARAAKRDVHYREVQSLWRAGLLAREIAARMNTTEMTVRFWLRRMRRDGWDVPFRRPDLASPAERHRTRADGTPSPSLGGGPPPPAGVAAQPLAAKRPAMPGEPAATHHNGGNRRDHH